MKIGIVGHGQDKFTYETEVWAKDQITKIINKYPDATIVSGHSPLGGVDLWAEKIAIELNNPIDIKTPIQHSWEGK